MFNLTLVEMYLGGVVVFGVWMLVRIVRKIYKRKYAEAFDTTFASAVVVPLWPALFLKFFDKDYWRSRRKKKKKK